MSRELNGKSQIAVAHALIGLTPDPAIVAAGNKSTSAGVWGSS